MKKRLKRKLVKRRKESVDLFIHYLSKPQRKVKLMLVKEIWKLTCQTQTMKQSKI